MILLIDNYDSFSYNLYQLIGEINPDIKVIRNDEMTVEEIRQLKPERIILSPGPGRPEDALQILQVNVGKRDTGSWCLPGPSGHLRCFWSYSYLCEGADAWKTVGGDV